MESHLSNIVRTDERYTAILTRCEDLAQLADGIHNARLHQILYRKTVSNHT